LFKLFYDIHTHNIFLHIFLSSYIDSFVSEYDRLSAIRMHIIYYIISIILWWIDELMSTCQKCKTFTKFNWKCRKKHRNHLFCPSQVWCLKINPTSHKCVHRDNRVTADYVILYYVIYSGCIRFHRTLSRNRGWRVWYLHMIL
jgi:hypothetical protein